MGAGKYRDTVEIQEIAGTEDAFGQKDLDDEDNWIEFATRKAHVSARGGREFFRGGQIQADVSHQVTIRSDSTTRAITSEMRIVWGTKTLQITTIHEADNKQRELILLCIES